ncbi:hypothetical protein EDD22DRAFT_1000340 [Suillus occidentalis]|nr:hypothetical protein EDD22DRAFT_1000340 [Suillus occidentalis]
MSFVKDVLDTGESHMVISAMETPAEDSASISKLFGFNFHRYTALVASTFLSVPVGDLNAGPENSVWEIFGLALQTHTSSQAQASHSKLSSQITEIQAAIDSPEDGVFASFCSQIGVENVREYEERQLKVSEEENQARLRLNQQVARLTHQSQLEEEQLKLMQSRLVTLQNTAEDEQRKVAELEDRKRTIQVEITEAQEGIAQLRELLHGLNDVLEEKNKHVDQAKKTHTKAAKILDQALKQIGLKNDEIEKLALERSANYRKCRLEDIKLPLLEGNLKNVPMEENLREEVAMEVDDDDVDFDSLIEEERADNSPETTAELYAQIAKLNGEIERMAPNLKAIKKLDDVEAKLADTEKEADKARKDSKNACDQFNDVKRKRRTTTFQIVSTKSIKTLPEGVRGSTDAVDTVFIS